MEEFHKIYSEKDLGKKGLNLFNFQEKLKNYITYSYIIIKMQDFSKVPFFIFFFKGKS